MNKNAAYTALVSLSGGISGFIFFTALSGGFFPALAKAQSSFLEPFLYIVIFSIAASALHVTAAAFVSAAAGIERGEAYAGTGRAVSLPVICSFLYPVLAVFEKKISAVELLILGNVLKPLSGYTDIGPAGYAFLALFGIIFTAQLAVFTLYAASKILKNSALSSGGLQKIVFIQLFILYAGTGLYTVFSYPPTGDEPYYMMNIEAVKKGYGLNLEPLYKEPSSYSKIYPGELDSSFRVHNAPGASGGVYTSHPPAVSLLVMPLYFVAGRFGAALVISVLSALLGALFFRYACALTKNTRLSYIGTGVFFMSAPLFVNSSLILTEIPAALLALYCFGYFTGAERKKNTLVLFICLALLPWFHLKFAVLSTAGALIYTAIKLRTKEGLLPEDLKGFAAAAVSLALFVWFYFSVFGIKSTGLYTTQDFHFVFDAGYMLKAFFAVQFDRNYGLLVYAPVYIAALWGMAEVVLKKEAEKIYGVIFACVYACVYLFWNDWTGSMTPARQLLPSGTIFALFGLMFINSHNLEKRKVFLAAAGLSVFIGWLLAALPILRYASSRNKLFAVLDAKAPGFMWFFPDFNAILTPALAVSALYFLLIITAFFYIRAAKKA